MTPTEKANSARHQTVQGTYAEALQLIAVRSSVSHGPLPVSRDRIAAFCGLIEDGNTSYWDENFCREHWGRPIAPPATLQSWIQPLPWSPEGASTLELMMMKVPLPGSTFINVSTEIEYHRPIYVGEILSYWDEVTGISPEKQTRLGIGHFITAVGHYQAAGGECVATSVNVLFRYEPGEPT
jgi:acyl dehydratase